jgi:ferric-dicitrate binding protein FerR (iron transport regulator)
MTQDGTNGGSADEMRNPSTDERAALEALKRLPHPSASGEVREKARAAFVRGETPPGSLSAVSPGPRRRARRLIPLAVAAAVVIALALFSYGNRSTHEWYVTDVVEPSGVRAGEAHLETGTRLASGVVSTEEGSELEIQLGDQLRFRMLPGTAIELPKPPGRWFGRSRTIRLTDGEIYGTTGGQGLAFDLRIETSEAVAEILGTTFAVLKLDVGTCVCLWTGGVTVTPVAGGDAVRLPDEMKYYVYNDGRPGKMEPIDPMERMKLSMTHDAGLISLEGDEP